ncbi:MAG: HNH endonuclease, partial [Myxococcota bacterium]
MPGGGMPRRVKAWTSRQARRPECRPNSAARGYCSAAWRRARLAVIARDEGICQLCGRLVTERHQIDHIIEKAHGGSDSLE